MLKAGAGADVHLPTSHNMLGHSMSGKHCIETASWTSPDQCVASGGHFQLPPPGKARLGNPCSEPDPARNYKGNIERAPDFSVNERPHPDSPARAAAAVAVA